MKITDIPTLETERLRLRPYRAEDFEAYATFWADPDVTRYVGGTPFSREAAWNRFLRQVGLWHYLDFGFFVLECRDTGAFLGEAGFHELHRAIEPSLGGTLEAGWAVAPSAQGRGLAQEAMRAAIDWATGHVSRDEMTCIIHPDNTPSLKVAGRLGFQERSRTIYGGAPIVVLARPARAAL
jgi:RimJ/RimL family protein N-acetyltransferase